MGCGPVHLMVCEVVSKSTEILHSVVYVPLSVDSTYGLSVTTDEDWFATVAALHGEGGVVT